MRFSIRSLLAIMLLCGISFPLVSGIRDLRRDEAMRSQLRREIETLRERLALDDPQRQRIKQHQRDELTSVRAIRERAERQFETIQQKYGGIEVRGTDVLSLRTVPQLRRDRTQPPVVFRVRVPTERDVWLKYAVIPAEGVSRSPDQLDQRHDPPADSGFAHPGHYERKLEPGEHLLAVQTGPVRGKVLPVAIRLGDKPLLDTEFSGDGIPSTGAYHISGRKQIDYPPQRRLPWLLSVKVKLRLEDDSRRDAAFDGCLWLSDRSSGYDPFPSLRDDP
ncbi:hypothetical protein Enr13x_76790 [Stieleria neptunia]|uniref:Uncharacterized protein n=1 Tax=Stieleria neptunia TaxID=2527979 RepID=A0A518I3Z7_9BACT|nr:hypothetical protein [Stieleria neptunia]QDV47767.1 hypothetical protein Enr13x_76790 [Stieleria neptunia]